MIYRHFTLGGASDAPPARNRVNTGTNIQLGIMLTKYADCIRILSYSMNSINESN